jgi:hypothetical protein
VIETLYDELAQNWGWVKTGFRVHKHTADMSNKTGEESV